jgi:hypothetical protein
MQTLLPAHVTIGLERVPMQDTSSPNTPQRNTTNIADDQVVRHL